MSESFSEKEPYAQEAVSKKNGHKKINNIEIFLYIKLTARSKNNEELPIPSKSYKCIYHCLDPMFTLK